MLTTASHNLAPFTTVAVPPLLLTFSPQTSNSFLSWLNSRRCSPHKGYLRTSVIQTTKCYAFGELPTVPALMSTDDTFCDNQSVRGSISTDGTFCDAQSVQGSISTDDTFCDAQSVQGSISTDGTFCDAQSLQGSISTDDTFCDAQSVQGSISTDDTFCDAQSVQGSISTDDTFCDAQSVQGSISTDGTFCDAQSVQGSISTDDTFCDAQSVQGSISTDGTFCDAQSVQGSTFTDDTFCDAQSIQGSIFTDDSFCYTESVLESMFNEDSTQSIEALMCPGSIFCNPSSDDAPPLPLNFNPHRAIRVLATRLLLLEDDLTTPFLTPVPQSSDYRGPKQYQNSFVDIREIKAGFRMVFEDSVSVQSQIQQYITENGPTGTNQLRDDDADALDGDFRMHKRDMERLRQKIVEWAREGR
ncbi:hypothetical protein L211DRAFT_852896 [Terfezia boudieri ATCC MYA-4762]|uniref:Uncharacterized protein n=1 Tax=Terfezia boudieri ATCC MYA-4762 TaxID=1051890 RepID=A0A3N4LGH5_9PEZI|nr:hypothetical protein L211DRAFT_852896 [Terfezia boudieri ATCC MYA-4762]